MALSSNWSIKSCGIYHVFLSGLSWKIWICQSVKWDWNLYVGITWPQALKSFIYSAVIIVFFVSWWWADIHFHHFYNSSGLCCLLKGNKVPSPWSFVTTSQGAMSQELKRQTCCMRSQLHERLWPPLLKLKFGNGWLTSKCCGSSCKKINSGFQFQFQFQGFQFHFQFHQFQFQFQYRNWNWNWAAIPISELNWPQPWFEDKEMSGVSCM